MISYSLFDFYFWLSFRAAALSGLLVPPFMLVSSFTFITGGSIDRLVCDNIISREIFVEVHSLKNDCINLKLFGLIIAPD